MHHIEGEEESGESNEVHRGEHNSVKKSYIEH